MPISSSAAGLLLAFAAQAEAPAAAQAAPPSTELRGENFDDWVGVSSPGRYSTAGTRNEAGQNLHVTCENSQCRTGFLLLTSCSADFVYRVRIEATSGTFDDELVCVRTPAGNFHLVTQNDEPYRKAIAQGGRLTLNVPLDNGETQTAHFSLKGGQAVMAWADRAFEPFETIQARIPPVVMPSPFPLRQAKTFDDWQAGLTARYTTALTRTGAGGTLFLRCGRSGCLPEINLSKRCIVEGLYPVRVQTALEAFDDYLFCEHTNGEFLFVPQSSNYQRYEKAIAQGGEMTISFRLQVGEKQTARFSMKGGEAARAWAVREAGRLKSDDQ